MKTKERKPQWLRTNMTETKSELDPKRNEKTIEEPQNGQSLKKEIRTGPDAKTKRKNQKKKNPQTDPSLKQEERTEPNAKRAERTIRRPQIDNAWRKKNELNLDPEKRRGQTKKTRKESKDNKTEKETKENPGLRNDRLEQPRRVRADNLQCEEARNEKCRLSTGARRMAPKEPSPRNGSFHGKSAGNA